MSAPVNNTGGFEPTRLAWEDRVRGMAAFDRLPPVLRRRLAAAKFNFSSIELLDIERTHGLGEALRVIDVVERDIERGAR